MSLGISGHQSARARSVEWQTPPEIISALGAFDDDPCNSAEIWDGLSREWRGFVWLNPPYGRWGWTWLAKLADHGDGGIAIVFARTETQGFVREVWRKATALLFLAGRPHFYRNGVRAKGNSGGPLVLVGYGKEARRRLSACPLSGYFVSDWGRTG